MQTKARYISRGCLIVLLMMLIAGACKKSEEASGPMLTLTPEKVTGKSGRDTTVILKSASAVKSLVITKSINLKPDETFGTNGQIVVNPSSSQGFEYPFTYTFQDTEVDKLVGINFKVTDMSGRVSEKDLTVNTTVSGAQLLYSYKWNVKSILRTTANPAEETIKDCEKDDFYTFNKDSSMAKGYGMVPCDFDGFNIYYDWELTPDEKTLTLRYKNAFTGAVTTEVYGVKTLTKDKLELEIILDLSWLGLTDKEKFVYTFTTTAK
jgi:hypothetical protein